MSHLDRGCCEPIKNHHIGCDPPGAPAPAPVGGSSFRVNLGLPNVKGM